MASCCASGPGNRVIEGVQESRFRDPALLLDQYAMHHRDLPGGTAEAEARDAQPHVKSVSERDAVPWLRTMCCCDSQLSHYYRRFFLKNS